MTDRVTVVKYDPGKSVLEALRVACDEEMTATINLLGDCADAGCLKLAGEMKMKLDTPHYRTGAAIMPIPSFETWRLEHRTARKRADRCRRLGYEFAEIDRAKFSDDIHEINVSLPQRQGRPMSDGYLEHRQQGSLPEYPCPAHNIRSYGVLKDDTLVAYMTLYRLRELGMISMILGHGDHLRNDIMYALFQGMMESQGPLGGWFYYNLWNSGQDGLRYYKQRVGFAEGNVEWIL